MKLLVIKITLLLIVLLTLIIGALFFKREYKPLKTDAPAAQTQPTEQNGSVQTELLIQNGAIDTLTSFLAEHNTYFYGDFVNIENLYPEMTDELRQDEENKIEEIKRTATTNDYITVESKVQSYQLASYDAANGKIVLRVILEKNTYGGKEVHNPNYGRNGDVEENILIDRKGNRVSGTMNNLRESTVTETYEITGIRTETQWMVSAYQKIN